MNSGYILIDMKGARLDVHTEQPCAGIGAAFKKAQEICKPVYLGNMFDGTVEITPIPCYIIVTADGLGAVLDSKITVIATDDDKITVDIAVNENSGT